MMNFFASSASSVSIWMHVHMLFVGLAVFGLIAAVVWMIKYSKKEELKNIILVSLVIGILGLLLTAPAQFLALSSIFNGMDFDDDFMGEMMEHMEDFVE